MRTTFKTEKGTELPLMNLKGKEYLQVQHRIVWFTEKQPLWTITSRIVERSDQWILFEASILDEAGKIRASAHKFGRFMTNEVEKAETGAIGRALAFLGFGTQFTGDELEEGEELADSPAPAMRQKQEPPPVSKPAALSTKKVEATVPFPGGLTAKQISRLWGISKSHGYSNLDVFELLKRYGVQDPQELTKKQYDEVCIHMESALPPSAGSEIPF